MTKTEPMTIDTAINILECLKTLEKDDIAMTLGTWYAGMEGDYRDAINLAIFYLKMADNREKTKVTTVLTWDEAAKIINAYRGGVIPYNALEKAVDALERLDMMENARNNWLPK